MTGTTVFILKLALFKCLHKYIDNIMNRLIMHLRHCSSIGEHLCFSNCLSTTSWFLTLVIVYNIEPHTCMFVENKLYIYISSWSEFGYRLCVGYESPHIFYYLDQFYMWFHLKTVKLVFHGHCFVRPLEVNGHILLQCLLHTFNIFTATTVECSPSPHIVFTRFCYKPRIRSYGLVIIQ